ncbi:MAG: acyl-CoA thioesterase, partial [Planctomycetota bacterium]
LARTTPKPDDADHLALRVVTMPRETNPFGTIFGGVVLSYIDQAGFVEARRHGEFDWVTASIQRVDFRAPVNVGDILSCHTRATRFGRTSLDVRVEVFAERCATHERVHVTSATLTMVALRDGVPTPYANHTPDRA